VNFQWIPEINVGKRVQHLNFQQNIQLQYKAISPTINLLKETQKVKKTKEIFENGFIMNGCGMDHWMVESKEPAEVCKPKIQVVKSQEHVFIKDLIEHEKEHLKKLQTTSSIFKKIIDKTPGYISKMVRDHHIGLSGFLSDIIDLHEMKILPKFKAFKTFSEVIRFMLQLIENNEMYLYVSHAILYNSTLQWLNNYKIVLDALYSKDGSSYNKLEIHDIIEMYKDWIDDVCNELSKDVKTNADDISLCMDVEIKLDHLLDMIADGKKVAYIKEVSKNNIVAIDKLYQILEKREIICHPMVILFPRHDSNYGYRNPLDILKLGQFVRAWSEKVYSDTSKCYYYSTLFIFEQCIIYNCRPRK